MISKTLSKPYEVVAADFERNALILAKYFGLSLSESSKRFRKYMCSTPHGLYDSFTCWKSPSGEGVEIEAPQEFFDVMKNEPYASGEPECPAREGFEQISSEFYKCRECGWQNHWLNPMDHSISDAKKQAEHHKTSMAATEAMLAAHGITAKWSPSSHPG